MRVRPHRAFRQRYFKPELLENYLLGMVEGELFDILEEGMIDLRECGSAILYTDGVIEAMNSAREEYGQERFEEILRTRSSDTPSDLIHAVFDDISGFTAGIAQHDDITLVVLRWREQGERQLDCP